MKTLATLAFCLVLVAAGDARGEETGALPEVSLAGLEQVEKTRRREVYLAPGTDWSVYEQVLIDETRVAFRKNWLRDQNRHRFNRIRIEDMERIREDMARISNAAFENELTGDGGFGLALEAGSNVIRIAPRVVDLDVYAPDPRSAPGLQRSYAETAGRMTLELHLFDSQTGDLLAAFSGEREAPRRGYLQWANTVSNNQEFRIMLKSWARELSDELNDLKTQ